MTGAAASKAAAKILRSYKGIIGHRVADEIETKIASTLVSETHKSFIHGLDRVALGGKRSDDDPPDVNNLTEARV